MAPRRPEKLFTRESIANACFRMGLLHRRRVVEHGWPNTAQYANALRPDFLPTVTLTGYDTRGETKASQGRAGEVMGMRGPGFSLPEKLNDSGGIDVEEAGRGSTELGVDAEELNELNQVATSGLLMG